MRWISPDQLGPTTQTVSTAFLKQNGLEVVNEWHHSPHGVDLFIWTGGPNEIIKFQLSVLGLILEWSHGSGLRTGMVIEQEEPHSVTPGVATDLVHYDAEPQNPTREYGVQIIKELKDLDPRKRALILNILNPRSVENWLSRTIRAILKLKK